jgi:hypothetical protein
MLLDYLALRDLPLDERRKVLRVALGKMHSQRVRLLLRYAEAPFVVTCVFLLEGFRFLPHPKPNGPMVPDQFVDRDTLWRILWLLFGMAAGFCVGGYAYLRCLRDHIRAARANGLAITVDSVGAATQT